MEASTILKIAEDALYNHFFIIDVIVSEDDSTIQAVIKHPSKGVGGQVMKSSNEIFGEEIPEPYFLAYPSHSVKVVANHMSSIVSKNRTQ